MALDSMQEIFDKMQEGQKPFWKVVQDTDVEERQVTPEASFEKMRMTWKAMLETVETYRGDLRSLSGLVGGDGQRMAEFAASGKALAGEYLSQVITLALCTAESNACMRKIVAAPTAGACGVLPAVLIPLYRRDNIPEERMLEAMFVASGIGAVIAYRACIAGASGGCQAEIGSACSMAAAALAELHGMELDQIEYAAEVAMEHHLGLTCDPVRGLVQIPCIERNAVAAMRAINALSLANFLTYTRKISFDVVVNTMYETGRDLFSKYRETGEGGLAKYYTGKK